MQNTNRKTISGRETALAMVGQVERQANDIATRYAGGNGISDRFGEFQEFNKQLDHFQLFIDMVEARLGDFEPEKQAAQAKNLMEIRWGMLQLEIEATRVFLDRMAESNKPWPLGSKPFLRRRLTRLDEIVAFHGENGAQHQFSALNETTLQAIRDKLGKQIGNSIALDDFSIAAAQPAAFVPASLEAPSASPPPPRPAAKAAKLPPPPPPKRVMRLQLREADGYSYITGDGLGVINDACKVANISLDELAKGMEISRPGLVLILNGRDPIGTPMLKVLRKFIVRCGGIA